MHVPVTFAAVDKSNLDDVLRITLKPDQERFVDNPLKTLAYCYARKEMTPYAVYCGKVLVGLVAMGVYGEESGHTQDEYWITRFMLDAKFQGKGLSKSILTAFLEKIDMPVVRLDVSDDAAIAIKLYLSVGFDRTDTFEVYQDGSVDRIYIWRKKDK